MMTKEPMKYGFKNIRWSFFEAGHGKGIPDAIGGSIKREADRKVHHGQDIYSADDFVNILKNCKTKLWKVDISDITSRKESLKDVKFIPISGTMKIHQVIVDTDQDGVFYRDLSCSCTQDCEHYST